MAGALAGPGLADTEQPAHSTISCPVGRIDEQRCPIDQVEPASDDRAHAGRLLRVPGPHDPRHRIAVDHADRGDAEQGSGREQFLG